MPTRTSLVPGTGLATKPLRLSQRFAEQVITCTWFFPFSLSGAIDMAIRNTILAPGATADVPAAIAAEPYIEVEADEGPPIAPTPQGRVPITITGRRAPQRVPRGPQIGIAGVRQTRPITGPGLDPAFVKGLRCGMTTRPSANALRLAGKR